MNWPVNSSWRELWQHRRTKHCLVSHAKQETLEVPPGATASRTCRTLLARKRAHIASQQDTWRLARITKRKSLYLTIDRAKSYPSAAAKRISDSFPGSKSLLAVLAPARILATLVAEGPYPSSLKKPVSEPRRNKASAKVRMSRRLRPISTLVPMYQPDKKSAWVSQSLLCSVIVSY